MRGNVKYAPRNPQEKEFDYIRKFSQSKEMGCEKWCKFVVGGKVEDRYEKSTQRYLIYGTLKKIFNG